MMTEGIHIKIVAAAAKVWHVKRRDFFTRDRHEPLAFARQVAMVLSMKRTGSAKAAGRFFKRDRTTVWKALRAVQARIETEPRERQNVERVKEAVRMISDTGCDDAG